MMEAAIWLALVIFVTIYVSILIMLRDICVTLSRIEATISRCEALLKKRDRVEGDEWKDAS